MAEGNPINDTRISILKLSKQLQFQSNNLEELESEIVENKDDFTNELKSLVQDNQNLIEMLHDGNKDEILLQLARPQLGT